jgi:exonuclease III
MKNKTCYGLLSRLIEENLPDFLILTEVEHIFEEIGRKISPIGYRQLFTSTISVVYFSKYDSSLLSDLHEDGNVSVKGFNTIIGPKIIIMAVHLPSKLFKDENDQMEIAQAYSELLEEIENREGHCNSIVIGDFNMNPFEKGMISHRGFNSTFFRYIANGEIKKLNRINKIYMYNASVHLYNDHSLYHGTYYKKMHKSVEYYWYMLDQILVRPSLIKYLEEEKTEVIYKTETEDLIDRNAKPKRDYSDHLPIICEFNFTGG